MYVHIGPPPYAPREDFRPPTTHPSARLDRCSAERAALPVNAYVVDDVLMVEALLPGINPKDAE